MPKGVQRTNRETKKPKKQPAKEISPSSISAPPRREPEIVTQKKKTASS